MPCRYDPGPADYLRTEKQKTERLTADPTKPLEPQLGFDPDDF